MQRQKIIGLVGTSGSGKSTAAKRLCDRHGFVKVPFAKPLKDMLRAIGLTEREVDGDLKETPCDTLMGVPPRYAMQTLGTEWGRHRIHPGLWIKLWGTAVQKAEFNVVADDVRFPNEAALIRMLGGVLVRIRRPNGETDSRGDLLLDDGLAKSLGVTAHSSESALSDIACDWTVLNGGTVDDLARAIDDATFEYRTRA